MSFSKAAMVTTVIKPIIGIGHAIPYIKVLKAHGGICPPILSKIGPTKLYDKILMTIYPSHRLITESEITIGIAFILF